MAVGPHRLANGTGIGWMQELLNQRLASAEDLRSHAEIGPDTADLTLHRLVSRMLIIHSAKTYRQKGLLLGLWGSPLVLHKTDPRVRDVVRASSLPLHPQAPISSYLSLGQG